MIVGKPVDESTVTIVRDVLNNSNFKYCRFVAGCGFESYSIEKLENELCKTVSSKYEVNFQQKNMNKIISENIFYKFHLLT